MKYRRALELFYLKAKEEFDKRKTRGSEKEVGRITYFGCNFRDGKMILAGLRIFQNSDRPMQFPENYEWEEGPKIFQSIMEDMTE